MPEFVSLAELLGAHGPQSVSGSEAHPVLDTPSALEPDLDLAPKRDEDFLREIRYFHAHLRERLDVAVETLLCDISREVLARELLVAPVEITQIVGDALARYQNSEPLRIRVHPEDAAALSNCEVPVFCDESLNRGDAFVDLRNGSIDLSLQTRLDGVASRVLS
ncbi:MAG: FliH/SctL family protein [Candidatus Baltobacteraceae bacterium]